MADAQEDLLLGRLAVHYKMITMDQLVEATQAQSEGGVPGKLGDVLVAKGWITDEDRGKLLRAQAQYIEKRKQPSGAPPKAQPKVMPVQSLQQVTPAEGAPEAQPIQARPVTAQPVQAEPVQGQPVQGQPVQVQPVQAKAVQAQPVQGQPVQGQPVQGQPVQGQPVQGQPVQVQPVQGHPVQGQPVQGQPVQVQPVQVQPVQGQPVQGQPVQAQPVQAQAAASPAEEPDAGDPTKKKKSSRGPQTPANPDGPMPPLETTPAADPTQSKLFPFFKEAVRRGASDIHVHGGNEIRVRRFGAFEALTKDPFTPEQCREMLREILTPRQRQLIDAKGELDFSYEIPDVGRFRANVYDQQHGFDGVFRCIPPTPPTLAELNLPSILAKFTVYHQGMVLVTGPAGAGKSSTLAALVNIVNEERDDHILTIEDPVEYIQPSKRCIVNQRQTGKHTESFSRALRAALREDPDIIMIGELRDLETISLALSAAETGHLVIATMSTSNSVRTINRLVGVFPPNQQSQIRTMLAESLKAICSQRLILRADGQGRVPACEILFVNKAAGTLIAENKTFQMQSVLQTGLSQGMQMMDSHLNQLISEGLITREEAIANADDPKRITAQPPGGE